MIKHEEEPSKATNANDHPTVLFYAIFRHQSSSSRESKQNVHHNLLPNGTRRKENRTQRAKLASRCGSFIHYSFIHLSKPNKIVFLVSLSSPCSSDFSQTCPDLLQVRISRRTEMIVEILWKSFQWQPSVGLLHLMPLRYV
ncbi:hypothetical protein CSKR_202303 [Clonorchis sinensis]|uniref:Uncharacterized protein n=1 Tax=Clonorchis sinensis TaxID=79923 RepID=A0A8T1MUT7_CLOSI|nr:hypothetical protein CSKR_202303 [Clonorchis sinensis]